MVNGSEANFDHSYSLQRNRVSINFPYSLSDDLKEPENYGVGRVVVIQPTWLVVARRGHEIAPSRGESSPRYPQCAKQSCSKGPRISVMHHASSRKALKMHLADPACIWS